MDQLMCASLFLTPTVGIKWTCVIQKVYRQIGKKDSNPAFIFQPGKESFYFCLHGMYRVMYQGGVDGILEE